jgi:hypothetical protein
MGGETMNKELVVKAIRTAEKLRILEAEKAALQLSLEKALHIALLWPDAFAHGKAATCWEGAQLPAWHIKSGMPPHTGQTFVVTAGNGEVRKFPFDEVSTLLGGGLEV